MATALATAFGSQPGDALWPRITGRYRLGDVRHVFASTERASAVGYTAKVSFAEGMKRFADDELRAAVTKAGASA